MTPDASPWRRWRLHFEANADRPLPAIISGDAAAVAAIPAELRPHLARSLARFQIGEGGEGRVAREVWKVQRPTIDDDYRVALGLFVREEGRHARILAGAVRALGGALLRSTWSERLFVGGRRLAGLRLKVLCLLAAEVVGIGFYGAAAARCEGPLGAALAEIAADEAAHLGFHVELFRAEARSRAGRAAFAAAWLAVAGAACALVLIDHRRALRALGVPLEAAARGYAGLLAEVLAAVMGGAAPQPTATAAEAAR